MYGITDQWLWVGLVALFLLEQLRVLQNEDYGFVEVYPGFWKSCPVLLENSRYRIVWLPVLPTRRVFMGPQGTFELTNCGIACTLSFLPRPAEVKQLQAFLRAWQRASQLVQLASTGLALCLVVLILLWAGLLTVNVPYVMRWSLATTFACWSLTAFFYWQSARTLRQQGWGDVSASVADVLLSPLSAIKAYSLLGKQGFRTYHFRTVAWALAPQTVLHQWARNASVTPNLQDFTTGVSTALETSLSEQLQELLQLRGTELSVALAAPHPDSDASCFCPRCQAQFTRWVERCGNCTLWNENLAVEACPEKPPPRDCQSSRES